MASIDERREELEAKIAGKVGGMRTYAVFPDTLSTPAAVVYPSPGVFMQRGGFGDDWLQHYNVDVFVGLGAGYVQAQKQLDGYLSTTGSTSLVQAINGIAGASVVRIEDYGEKTVQGADAKYLGATIRVEWFI